MDINQITQFMCENQINSRQFLLLWCLFNDPLYTDYVKEKGKSKRVHIYNTGGSIGKLRYVDPVGYKDVETLVEMGLVLNTSTSENIMLDELLLTQKFCEQFFISKDSFEDLWEEYPVTLNIDNKVLPARSGDYDSLRDKYLKLIGKDLSLHQQIVSIVRNAKEAGIINIGLEKFILGKHWITYYTMLEEPTTGKKVI